LPNLGLEAMPLSYEWDCENAIVFVCVSRLEGLRKFYLVKRSAEIEVQGDSRYESKPVKLNKMISFTGVSYFEVFATHGDQESKDAEGTDSFVSFYHCQNMNAF
jgi:hypothetical protein